MTLFLMLSITGCTLPTRIQGAHYVHLLYQHPALSKQQSLKPANAVTLVFLEGDGIPWIAHGMQPSADPTPVHALAYNLYKSTKYPSWYLTRPCYNHVKDNACTNLVWTYARYSPAVVSSLVSAINTALIANPEQRLILVGYSGGGALATLIAPHITQVIGVITIAGNLDIDAWTALHGYEALGGSLNPVDLNELTVPHIAMIGDHDTNVPYSAITQYLHTHPHTIVEQFDRYDHICCWEKNWPALLDAALARMNIQIQ